MTPKRVRSSNSKIYSGEYCKKNNFLIILDHRLSAFSRISLTPSELRSIDFSFLSKHAALFITVGYLQSNHSLSFFQSAYACLKFASSWRDLRDSVSVISWVLHVQVFSFCSTFAWLFVLRVRLPHAYVVFDLR